MKWAIALASMLLLSSCVARSFQGTKVYGTAPEGLVAPLLISGKVVDATSPYFDTDDTLRNDLANANLKVSPAEWAEK
jgi:hypothetical protein